MPFGIGRRDERQGVQPQPQVQPSAFTSHERGVAFEGLTEEIRLAGLYRIPGRLSDALNRRQPVVLADIRWAPHELGASLQAAPGLDSVDPYELIVVLGREESQPPRSDAEKAAVKVHKLTYAVALEAPPFRVVGTVYLYPGTEPERLLDRAPEMFVPIADALVTKDGVPVSEDGVPVVLVNRLYLTKVEEIDRATGQPVAPMPEVTLGD